MTDDLWHLTHEARAMLADDLATLDDIGWHHSTLCGQWDVEHVVAHLTAAATTGRSKWIRSIVLAGFRPSVHNQRRLREHLGPTPASTLEQFRAAINASVSPTGQVAAMLGEVFVHGEDIRRPLGIPQHVDTDAATAVADFFARRNFAVNSKTIASGLHLRATDGSFDVGIGPEVSGPIVALIMTMAGRPGYLDESSGEGVPALRSRVA